MELKLNSCCVLKTGKQITATNLWLTQCSGFDLYLSILEKTPRKRVELMIQMALNWLRNFNGDQIT